MPVTLPDLQVTHEPLPEGRYYLVDIAPVIEDYLKLPAAVRMCAIGDFECFGPLDVLDIELSSIVPCLDASSRAEHDMKEHIENLLDDGREMVKFELTEQGVDTETRTILNTPDQLDHAKAVSQMGERLHEIFLEHKLYKDNGLLVGAHCTLLDGGVLVLREE